MLTSDMSNGWPHESMERPMASRRLREREDVYNAKHYPERWQDERDDDEEELPEREEPEPIHTTH